MRCSAVRDMLMDYVSAELPRSEMDRIGEHLAGCTECRGALEVARGASEVLSFINTEAPAPDLVGAVRGRLDRGARSRQPFPWPRLAMAGAVALVCMVVITGWLISRPDARHGANIARQPERVQSPNVSQPTAQPEPVVRPVTIPMPAKRNAHRLVAEHIVRSAQPHRELAANPRHVRSMPAPSRDEVRPQPDRPQIEMAVSPKAPESCVIRSQDQPDSPNLTVVRHFDAGGNVRSVTITDKASPANTPDSTDAPEPGSTRLPNAPSAGDMQFATLLTGGSITNA